MRLSAGVPSRYAEPKYPTPQTFAGPAEAGHYEHRDTVRLKPDTTYYLACVFRPASSASLRRVMTPIWFER
jgi:hypothetical protein